MSKETLIDKFTARKHALISHFLYDGWDIRIDIEDAVLIVAEMPFLDVYDRGEEILATLVRKPTIEECASYYREEALFYQNKYFDVMNKLDKIMDS